MIDGEIKNLIYDLEQILKKDKRFKLNGDDQYKNQTKKIYQESQYSKKPIDMTHLVNLINLNNTVDIGDLAYINHINRLLIKAKNKIDDIINN
jgi:hypothetical protein